MNSECESLARPGLAGATEEAQGKVSGVVADCDIKSRCRALLQIAKLCTATSAVDNVAYFPQVVLC